MSSESELNKFIISQLEHTSKSQKEAIEEAKVELDRKKQQTHKLTEEVVSQQSSRRQQEEKLLGVEGEKDVLVLTVDRLKQTIQQMRVSMQEDSRLVEQLGQLERELARVKTEKGQLEQHYERNVLELKGSLR